MKRILALPGSLRRGSYNRSLLQAAKAIQRPDMAIELFEGLAAVPLLNQDDEGAFEELPAGVRELTLAVRQADGLLIATPEYNQSIPGVLKNAIDWLSRESVGEPLIGKPVAIMGATVGPWGTRLSQAALRQTLTSTEALVMPVPMLFVREGGKTFSPTGQLLDERTQRGLVRMLDAFAAWIELVSRPRPA
jgi:chromate reductase, NAD(P)H dehydrogenase (quinone)